MKTSGIDPSLIKVARHIGQKIPLWTQGLGGNVSIKDTKILWVKSSGQRLDSVSEDFGISTVDAIEFRKRIDPILSEIQSTGIKGEHETLYSKLLIETCLSDTRFNRPSMETAFHALLPKRYVLHFHSLASILIAHEHASHPSKMDYWLAENWQHQKRGQIVFYPSLTPGLELASEIQKNQDATIHIIANHGLVIQDDSIEILQHWEKLEKDFAETFGLNFLLEISSFETLNLHQLIYQYDKKWSQLEIPIKIYFPDAAVFLQDLFRLLKPSQRQKDFYSFPTSHWTSNANIGEIWFATLILSVCCPKLSELDPKLISALSRLPTESFRQNKFNP